MTSIRHHKDGRRFRDMTDDELRRVMRRQYKYAGDQPADTRGAQAELRQRKAERTEAACDDPMLCVECNWPLEPCRKS